MSIEGLWTVKFESNINVAADLFGERSKGGGVVIFETERVFGGDSQYFYVGKYWVRRNKFFGDIEITKFEPSGSDIFGLNVLGIDRFGLELSGGMPEGTEIGTTCKANGKVKNFTDFQITIFLEKRAELP